MKKYFEAHIAQFDENNIPDTKLMVCVKADSKPSKEILELEFEEVLNEYENCEIGGICEIPEDEALESYEDEIVEL